MASTIEPKVPKEGWEIRWLKQSADLATRAPAVIGLLLIATVLMGMLSMTSLEKLGYDMFILVMMVILPGVAAGCLVVSLALVMEIDGRRTASWGEIARRALYMAVIVIVMNAAFYALNGILDHVSQALGGNSDQAASKARPGMLELIVSLGMIPLTLSMSATFVIMPFFLEEVARSGVRVGAAFFVAMRIWLQPKLLHIAVIKLAAMMFMPMLPTYLGLPSAFFLVLWSYVAAREIFGGITENKKQTAGQRRGVARTATA